MKPKIILLLLIALVLIACKQPLDKKEVPSIETKIVELKNTPKPIINWVNALQKNDINIIKELYAPKSYKIISTDSVLDTSLQIAEYYSNKKKDITSIESLFSIEANKERGINYELIKYTTNNNKKSIQLVIWNMQNGKKVRELEFTQRNSQNTLTVDKSHINHRRKLWMELCNTNNAKRLVEKLYSENTMYYNHKPLVTGREALIEEYAYMNNPNYNLTLHPLLLELVNENFAFEIGQCKGSYGGKYILVWKKDVDGIWNIYIDSNI